MLQKYKLGFEAWGLLLFLIIMAPNLFWFAIPAPNDILRADSMTEKIDEIASACQILMAAALCVLKNRESEKISVNPVTMIASACGFLYYVSWIIYYAGVVNKVIVLGLVILPCLAFLLFAIDRKNNIAIIAISVFTICHLIFGVVNFMI